MIDWETINDDLEDKGALVPAAPSVLIDISSVSQLFNVFVSAIDKMDKQARELTVDNESARVTAVEMVGQTKRLLNKIEKTRREQKEPFLRAGKAIDGLVSPLSMRLRRINDRLHESMLPYLQQKKITELEIARKAQEEAVRLREEAAKKRKEAGEDSPPEAPIVAFVPSQETKISTEFGSSELSSEWHGTIVDIVKLIVENPTLVEERGDKIAAACQPWLNAKVKAGVRNIEGAQIQLIDTIKSRTKRG